MKIILFSLNYTLILNVFYIIVNNSIERVYSLNF